MSPPGSRTGCVRPPARWGTSPARSRLRRLNRREYHNTVRDLLGVDFNVSELFPNDGTGGAGFDTNGETLFIPPLLMERYMEAAQQILDRAIVTPDLLKTFQASELIPAGDGVVRELAAGKELSAPISIYLDGDYDVRVAVDRKDGMGTLSLKVDGATGVPLDGPAGPRRPRWTGWRQFRRTRRAPACLREFACGSRAACGCCRSSPMERRSRSRV